nr:EOG090X0JRY [Ilyocryptus agilis]
MQNRLRHLTDFLVNRDHSFTGWFHLGIGDWMHLLPFGVVVAGVSYLAYDKVRTGQICCKKACSTTQEQKDPKDQQINKTVDKENSKVVHQLDIEEIGDKKVFCRCWRSKKFPYCDGSHVGHNVETGDNIGPLIVAKKSN